MCVSNDCKRELPLSGAQKTNFSKWYGVQFSRLLWIEPSLHRLLEEFLVLYMVFVDLLWYFNYFLENSRTFSYKYTIREFALSRKKKTQFTTNIKQKMKLNTRNTHKHTHPEIFGLPGIRITATSVIIVHKIKFVALIVVSLFQLWFLRDVNARDALVQSIIELWDWKLVFRSVVVRLHNLFLYPRLFFFIIMFLWVLFIFGCPGQARLHSGWLWHMHTDLLVVRYFCSCLAVLLPTIIF